MKKIVIAGGSGFLGSILQEYFLSLGYRIVVLTRHHQLDRQGVSFVKWDARHPGAWVNTLENATALINLTGRSVDCRYTSHNRQIIYSSRIEATQALGTALLQVNHPPEVWINASSATIYRDARDRDMDELTGEYGSGFSVDVCRKWEKAFQDIQLPATRKVILRIAIVLGGRGGALAPLKNLTRVGMGGRLGDGGQYFSWLHEKDFARIVKYCMDHPVEGIYNASSPEPVINSKLMARMRKHMGMPLGLPQPACLLEAGARLIGTETELILKSRRVVPARLLREGFHFQYGTLDEALDACMKPLAVVQSSL